jgi:ferric-chelate reductase
MADAVFRTSNLKISDMVIIKIFPDNLFFYLFLVIAPAVGLVIRSSSKSERWWRRKVLLCSISSRRQHIFTSFGELLFGGGFLLLAFLFTWYWGNDHNYNGYWDGISTNILQSERVARTLGQVATLLMSLLMFPAARQSFLSTFFGISWEASIKYHRWLGIAFLMAALAHMVANWFWYSDTGSWPRDIIAIPMHLETSIDNFTVPLAQLVLWLSLPAFALAIWGPCRRQRFEWFMNTHHIMYSTLIPAVLWHAQAAWYTLYVSYYLCLSFLFICVDLHVPPK